MKRLETFLWNKLSEQERNNCLKRPISSRNADLTKAVNEIIQSVRLRGDEALMAFTRRFDSPSLSSFAVSQEELDSATTSDEVINALREASRRIRLFHEAQKPVSIKLSTSPGVVCERRYFPISRVGLYIPGGTAPLPSTLMMLAIPALVAGCEEIVLVTPPNAEGKINPVILSAAKMLGVQRIFKCGGAQAIAALAYGTESIPKVDKIFGPGNAWVTEAKMQVAFDSSGAAIDLPAGPSEVMVIADENAFPQFVAADLLSQAEHDENSQVILVAFTQSIVDKVRAELSLQVSDLPRAAIAEKALRSSRAIIARDLSEAMEIANFYAPEHLILQVQNATEASTLARNAGSVFIGPWTPESVGDYASGTNHVLPTYGFARAFSGLGVESFLKSVSFQELSPEGLSALGPVVESLATAEGLEAHRRAVSLRLAVLSGLQNRKGANDRF